MLSPPSMIVRSIPPAWTAIFSAKKRASVRARVSVTGAQRGQGILGEHAAAGRVAEQAQIGRRAGKRRIGRFLRQQPARRSFETVDRLAEPRRAFAQDRCVACAHGLNSPAKFVDIECDRLAAFQRNLACDQVERLNAVGAFVDRRDARIAEVLRRTCLLDVAHAAVHLHAKRCDLDPDVGGKRLGDRGQQ